MTFLHEVSASAHRESNNLYSYLLISNNDKTSTSAFNSETGTSGFLKLQQLAPDMISLKTNYQVYDA